MTGKRQLSPFFWCSRCGARRALLGGEVCRICIARPGRLPDHANRPRTRARARYRAVGWCTKCGGERDRPDRLGCRRCRQLQADATMRYRATHPPDRARLYADVHARRRKRIAAGLCGACGGARDRAGERLLWCARCRRRAADKQRAHRRRRQSAGTAGEDAL